MTDTYRECMATIGGAARTYRGRAAEGINSVVGRTDWKLLARQKQCLVRLLRQPTWFSNSEWDSLKGLLAWIDAIQEAAEAEGYPVEFLAE